MGAPVDSVRRRHAARVLHRPLAACACELFPPHTDAGAHNELAAGRGRRYAKSLRLSACCGVRSHCWACVEAHERSPPSSSQQGRHHGHTTQAQLLLGSLGCCGSCGTNYPEQQSGGAAACRSAPCAPSPAPSQTPSPGALPAALLPLLLSRPYRAWISATEKARRIFGVRIVPSRDGQASFLPLTHRLLRCIFAEESSHACVCHCRLFIRG